MDVGSMMRSLATRDASKGLTNGMGLTRGNGMLTSAKSITGAGRQLAARVSTAGPKAAGAAVNGSATTSQPTGSSQITSSDFLTLLVAEMQNQDPTQPTDPNTYIQQLVSVNSLQQLIAINTDLGGSAASTGASGSISGDPTTKPVV